MTDANSSNAAREENVSKLLETGIAITDAGFETAVRLAVLAEVARERRRVFARRVAALAAAAVLLICAGTFLPWRGSESSPAARVITRYGLVRMTNGSEPVPVTTQADLAARRSVECAWGSAADVILRDKSVLRAGSKTVLSVDETRSGAKVALSEGALSVTASKQDKGKSLTIETPGAELSIIGTAFDVMVFPRAGGAALTDVRVLSGEVTLSSGGKSVTLRSNMRGLVEEGKPPEVRSLTWEVEELLRLWELARAKAAASGGTAGAPSLVDVALDGSATVWTVETVANKSGAPLISALLHAKEPVADATVFTCEGALLRSRVLGSVVDVDLSQAPVAPGGEAALIVKVAGVTSLLSQVKRGVYAFDAAPAGRVTAVEFRYDDSVALLACEPKPVESGHAGGRNLAVFLGNSESIELFD